MTLLHWSLIYLISEWAIRLIMLIYVPRERSAAAARTWLLLIFLLPWPGLILYLVIGRVYLPKSRIEQQRQASQQICAVQAQMGLGSVSFPDLPANLEPLVKLATKLGDFQPFGGNSIQLLSNYEESLNSLIEEIDRASRHVHLLYYIYGDDEWGIRCRDALIRAAQRGVHCRVLLDAVGSKAALRNLAPGLRKAGIEVHAALRVQLFRRNSARFDLRNHRKIAIIDGKVAYTGSQNIVSGDFVRGYPNRELVVRVTGPVVAQFQAVFVADRFFETGTTLDQGEVFPTLSATGSSILQVVPSGPGYERENGQELMVSLLYAARKRVVLSTPYFVPDETFFQGLRSAAHRGVDVHLVLSEHANKLFIQLAQRSYYDELLQEGVNIHLYRPGFLHAKHMSVDDQIAIIGSTNIDIRSFALNSEINLLLYDTAVIVELKKLQEHYFANSSLLSLEEWRRRPLMARTLHGIARLADTLL
ncbi:MAG TPA: cardiolipin synthase [Candidatus Saccharimonadales bacterium]|nr:cardiolipin synthase [Candidatus Saccharimonadales bacterium]